MAIPLLPAPLDARFDADGFRCVVRTRDVLLPPEAMAAVSVSSVSLAVTLSMTVGPRFAADFAGWILMACLAAALLVGGRAVLDLLLAAPHRTRLDCSHEALDVEVRVLGVRCLKERLPLAAIERCEVGDEGIGIQHLVDGRRRRLHLRVPPEAPETCRIAEEIERAAARRRRFEQDHAAAEREDALARLQLLLDQSDSGKRKRLTAGR